MQKLPPPISMLLIVFLVGATAWCGAAVLRQDRTNWVLITAVEQSDTRAAIAALDAGASPNARTDAGFRWTMFWWHLRRRYAMMRGGDTILYQANEPTALMDLLEPFEDDDPRRANGIVLPENVALTKVLLDRGADVNTHDFEGETPLTLAAQWGYTATAQLLLDRGARVNAAHGAALSEAAQRGNSRLVELLLSRGADVNAHTGTGFTPLICAALRGRVGIVKRLLRADAKVDARDSQGCTALMWAVADEKADAVRVLLAAGADPNARDAKGQSALAAAARGDDCEIVHLLKKAGAR
jgi:ankyrin repeat protein